MYHLLKGLHEYLTRKDEFSIVIVGLDGAGKTTLLEQIKSLYHPNRSAVAAAVTGGGSSSSSSSSSTFNPQKIHPTVGQNTGQITLPSTILKFWDLGGQRGIRNIWSKYYGDAHAVVFVLDAEDRERLGEGWEAFDAILTSPQVLPIPLLLLANKQDSHEALSPAEIRHSYEDWYQRKLESMRRQSRNQQEEDSSSRRVRMGSLNVLGISAIEGTGVREVVDWLFIRVQNSRRDVASSSTSSSTVP